MRSLLFLSGIILLTSPLAHAQFDMDPPKIQPIKKQYTGNIQLSVWFDCYVDTNLSCIDLEKAFFEADKMARAANSEKSADVIVKFRDWQIPPLEQYEATFVDNSGQVTTFTMGKQALQIRATLTPIGKIQALMPHLLQGLLIHHSVQEYQYNPTGQLTATFNPKAGAAATVSKEPPPFYFQTSGGGFAIVNTPSKNIIMSGTMLAGYTQASPTNPGWLVEYEAGMRYNYASAPLQVGTTTQTISAANWSYNNGLIVAKSLAKHWSVATLVREDHDPSSNYATRTQVHGGIEYELIPYLTSNDNTFTINYLVGGNYETYVLPNVHNLTAEALATHAISVYYVYHHAHAFDISGSVGWTSLVNDPTQYGVGGSIGATIYLTSTLTLDISGNLGYKNNLVNAPANPTTDYQLLTLMGVGTNLSQTTYFTRVMLTYVWGGTLTRKKDTRWQFTSDEVPNNF